MPVWIRKDVALVFHNEQLAEHGGSPGIRDEELLESALACPKNLAAYSGKAPSLFRLAAAYASGIVRSHPFVDGNKRTALVVAVAFLELNGIRFDATQEETFLTIYELATGRVSEEQLTEWLERNSTPAK